MKEDYAYGVKQAEERNEEMKKTLSRLLSNTFFITAAVGTLIWGYQPTKQYSFNSIYRGERTFEGGNMIFFDDLSEAERTSFTVPDPSIIIPAVRLPKHKYQNYPKNLNLKEGKKYEVHAVKKRFSLLFDDKVVSAKPVK